MRAGGLLEAPQSGNKWDLDDCASLCAPSGAYPYPTSIQHWQLRDLLHCPDAAGQVYTVSRRSVMRHSLDAAASSRAVELTFEPSCMTVGHGYIAAGGQGSQLDVRRLEGGGRAAAAPPSAAVFRGRCGGSVNNALKIQRDATGRLRLFVCNNDNTIKTLSLATGRVVGVVRAPCAINYCCLSPDGRQLVAVGDNRSVLVYQATPAGWRTLRSLTEARDAGMCCDWAPSGSMFAAAAQDGVTAVWDHRAPAPVAALHTQLAARSVKFSPAPLDLLAVGEHRGRAHLVDARVWGRRQVVRVGEGAEEEPDIAGMAFSPCGRALYVATEAAVVALDVDTAARRSFAAAELC
jgi:hypothetical protein